MSSSMFAKGLFGVYITWLSHGLVLKRFVLGRVARTIERRIFRRFRRAYKLIALRDYLASQTQVQQRLLLQCQIVEYPAVQLSGPILRKSASRAVSVPGRAIYLTTLNDVEVLGNTNFFFKDRLLIHPDDYVANRDISPAELYAGAKIDLTKGHMSFRTHLVRGAIWECIPLCNQTLNYAHWLTEVMPILAVASTVPDLVGVPILFDSSVPDVYVEMLAAILPAGTLVYKLDPYQRVRVFKLHLVTPATYYPHDWRLSLPEALQAFDFRLNNRALTELRRILRRRYANFATNRNRKLYLKRNSLDTWNKRNITNIEDVESVIEMFDYETTNVTGMSFADQARLFINARKIVAPTGAFLANMIFCEEGCEIVVMAATYEGANYDYFHRLAHALGHNIRFVVGVHVDDTYPLRNRCFEIPLDALADTLRSMNRPASGKT